MWFVYYILYYRLLKLFFKTLKANVYPYYYYLKAEITEQPLSSAADTLEILSDNKDLG